MRTIIELDSNEIKEAIAEKYGCAVGQIDLRTKKEPALYGMGDAFAYTTIARIEKDRKTDGMTCLNGDSITSGRVAWDGTNATNAAYGVTTIKKQI